MSKIHYHVVVVGCGGTGGFFIKEFGRFMMHAFASIQLTLIDGDIVEESNLERQCFQKEDIQSNKATILAEALVSCYGIPDNKITSFPVYLDRARQLRDILEHASISRYDQIEVPIIIGAVDNHAARTVLHEYFMDYMNTGFYYDSANEYAQGEVVFAGKADKRILANPRGILFPHVLEEGKTETKRSERSCSEINVREPQHIATNMLAANLLLSKVCQVITGEDIRLGVAFFHAFQCEVHFYEAKRLEEESDDQTDA